jgi:hypothetical protein
MMVSGIRMKVTSTRHPLSNPLRLQHQSSIGCSVHDFLFQFYFQRQDSNIIQVLDYLVFLEIAQTRPSMILEC